MKPARFLHLVAHRGDAAGHPENTLPAFQSALDLGVRFIEVDVQLAANGVPVAVRDPMIMTPDGVRMVGDLTAAELTQVDASEPARFGERFRGTCIPRLVDVLSLLTKRPETTVFVTIGNASIVRFGHEQVVAQLLEALKPFRPRCVVVAADLPAVHRARQAAGFPIGWAIPSFDNHTRIKYEALQPEFLFCERGLLPESYQLWRGPWRWVVRDVPTLDIALDLAAHGADFVATPDARSLGEAMRAHAATLAPPRNLESTIADDATTVARTTLVPRAQKI
ncbi:MAG TPA: glycerophosphodiester phosphodiesterase family protein [Steroidobacteraceae bacterium]|jgi:glycerophosphoryl diester phosphodiesterase|nr:glycerophosphodiester phosphodiesterase family protein [Steroidobacteraceae bacterium]